MAASPPGDITPEQIISLGEDHVRILDQRRLPTDVVHVALRDWREVVDAIQTMAIRGAPAIGIAGAMGVALASSQHTTLDALDEACDTIRAARPTAVNLSWAVDKMRQVIQGTADDPDARRSALFDAAQAIHRDEVARCEQIGRHGRALLHRQARILTHCNAGALATGGYGTALGIVRAAFAEDREIHVFVDETRPLLQGARLTAWECHRAGIPHTVITDSMVGSLMADGAITHVIVGADRIAANGDVVNKIGTYGVAVIAREHGVPVIVAAPTSTLDLTLPSARQIPIEERDPAEVTGVSLFGHPAANPGSRVVNPAFDRTPHHLVAAIVTEHGIHRPPYERTLRDAWDQGMVAPSSG